MAVVTVFVLFMGLISSSMSQNCWQELLKQADLTEIRKLLELAEFNSTFVLNNPATTVKNYYTLFAPTNLAWAGVTKPTTKIAAEEEMNKHIVFKKRVMDADIKPGSSDTSHAIAATILYYSIAGGNKYVNQAMIKTPAISCTNGIIYKITKVLDGYDGSALAYLTSGGGQPNPYSKFADLLDAMSPDPTIKNELKAVTGPVTLFIPNNAAIEKIGNTALQELKRDKVLLKKVIGSHILLQRQFTFNLANQGDAAIATLAGAGAQLRPSTASDGKVQVNVNKSANAKIISGDIAVSNGVVHIVDNILNYVFNTMWSTIKDEQILDSLERQLENTQSDAIRSALQSGAKQTLFAPVNDAFTYLPQDIISSNLTGAAGNTLMENGWIKGTEIKVTDITNGGNGNMYTTASGKTLRVYSVRNGVHTDTYVEVDHVKARVVSADVGTKNGMLHYVDRILGLPNQTMTQEMQTNPLANKYMAEEFEKYNILKDLQNKRSLRWTAFVVTDKDMNESLALPYVAKLISAKILNRHVLEFQQYCDGVNTTAVNLPTRAGALAGDKETLQMYKRGQKTMISFPNVKAEAEIVQCNIQVTNGVVHIINDLLIGTEAAERITSGSDTHVVSYLTTVLSLGFLIMYVRT